MASRISAPSTFPLLHSSRLTLPFHKKSTYRIAGPNNNWTKSRSSGGVFSLQFGLRRFSSMSLTACVKQEAVEEEARSGWGKVSAVLFDMDGVLCNSEDPSRRAAVDVFAEMGVDVSVEDFVPFMGTGEANFLGGVASVKEVKGFNTEEAKKRFFEIYLDKYAKPNSGIGFPGAIELINECKRKGLKVAVASSADRIKVDANLAAAGLPLSLFDAIVSADAFENLKPAPDIFLAASKILGVPTEECIVIEDALAGVQAAKAAQMRCISVTTTLSEESLLPAGPTLIRKDIGDISIHDIVNGGSSFNNERSWDPQFLNDSASDLVERPENGSAQATGSTPNILSMGAGTRRDILRYGSLGISVSCLLFAFSNRKAMQYASPKALWNMLFGVNRLTFNPNKEDDRVQKFMDYISELETRGDAPVVPEFPAKLDWLNSAPLHLGQELKGKVVLLDFWTYCCINCMHVLPDLDYLEKKYRDSPFAVVGVHSAKFDNEKDLDAIRNAVLRYDVTHPVVNDGDMYMWRELGVSSWPTFVVVGPNGKVLAQLAGEGRRQDLDDLVAAAILFYGQKKLLNNTPLPLNLERDNDPRLLASPLKYPGKIALDALNNRLFISDSNHNRIVVTTLDGNFIVQIGSTGEEGLQDGSFDDATFNRPQGLAYSATKNILYVADTENHALREIDFVNETVRTLAGNGTKGSDYKGGGKGSIQVLNSPWDVCVDPASEKVYIAMAGQHQIWEYDTVDGTTRAFSGDGYERNLNGSSSTNTSFAQPSGISISPDSKDLYVADSESSSIRAVNLKTGGSRLLVGGDPFFAENLFKFGDHDGTGSEVLLQHPLGVLCGDGVQIYIADSYNHKIKKLNLMSNKVTTIAGTGKAGFKDGLATTAQLSEPAGLVKTTDGRLFIADTNNSVIRYLDLNKKDPELLTLELKRVLPPAPKLNSLKRLRRRSLADTQIIKVDGSSSSEGDLSIRVSLPDGYHFSKEARSKYSFESDPEDSILIDSPEGNLSADGSGTLHYKRKSPASAVGKVYCKVYYCKEDEVCLYRSLAFEVQFHEVAQEISPTEIKLSHIVKPKQSISNNISLPVSK